MKEFHENQNRLHHYQDLIEIFERCFFADYKTKLVKGGEEPLYEPASQTKAYAAIYFARGYFSSALHETAHWLLAGNLRRRQIDYGYWYLPDGRTPEEQQAFEAVEAKPQALEWILSFACGYKFKLSCDNLNGEEHDLNPFKKAVLNEVHAFCRQGLPQRAAIFRLALIDFYQIKSSLLLQDFSLDDL